MSASAQPEHPVVSGILLLDKPVGLSSNAALARAKRVLGLRKAGHTGTLDPLASGLLALCFGEATKVAGFLLDSNKAYLAEATLGVVTDSEDAEGEVLERKPVADFSRADIEAALACFRGPIEQVPPMHSALKHQGQRLYELARRGETVDRPPRPVTIHALDLVEFALPRLSLHIACSKGTYVRSLIRDLGRQLGCGAHMSALRRTESQPFSLEQAVSLAQLEQLDRESARALLLSPDQALQHLPAMRLEAESARRLLQGQRLAGLAILPPGLVRVYAEAVFLGIGQTDGEGRLRPKRLFAS
ncbi:MAG: tRNA pseudouridine(55) synthase TruB [Wenzhouxiangella sp.]|nr:tRNA pseudouridine(55) synthase TruB [Wenzhouxiangella sp.]MCH8477389.1 tRNA pseudouridine(55) synthase TruB [Wenzhouxiangella sp.]TVR96591.1 MAG: tRNA pseudouridine(55) synthase TruB [Wenzhouxiangellaceae bacterium]